VSALHTGETRKVIEVVRQTTISSHVRPELREDPSLLDR
jgi:hypothetical protein